MSTKKKLLISLCSICLVAAVVIIGVFAFATQTFTLNNRVTFTANDVKADVMVLGLSDVYDGDIYSGAAPFEFADGSNKLWTDDENSFFNGMGQPGDGEADSAISWSIDAASGSDLNTTYSVPDQNFAGEGNHIALLVWVVNQGDKAFTVTMTDSYLEALKNVDNVTITTKFFKTNGFNANFEGKVPEMPTYDETTPINNVTAAENGVTLAKGEGCLVKIMYELKDMGLNADVSQAHQFVLQGV